MRKNKGTRTGTFVGNVFEGWAIYQTEAGYRVSSKAPVVGKANYSFAIGDDRRMDRSRSMDIKKLEEERPELYAAIEQYFGGASSPVHPSADDEFGDLAMTQKRTLTPLQEWKRSLLMMRKHALMARALKDMSVWEAGIRMHYAGIFKFKIDDDTFRLAVKYVTGGSDSVDLQTLLAVIRDYYDGKYKPSACATLEQQFDMVAGKGNNDLLG